MNYLTIALAAVVVLSIGACLGFFACALLSAASVADESTDGIFLETADADNDSETR